MLILTAVVNSTAGSLYEGSGAKQSDMLLSADSCNNAGCYVDSIIVNTGYNQNRFSPYQIGQKDNFWELIMSPDTNIVTPQPSIAIMKFSSWNDPFANSQWLSAYNSAWMSGNNPSPKQPYAFQFTFCTCGDVDSLEIDLEFMVDDTAVLFFDSSTEIARYGTPNVPYHLKKVIPAATGMHGLRFEVRNESGPTMGICCHGTIKKANSASKGKLISQRCCFDNSSIFGKIIYDKNCNGLEELTETGLSGWKVQLFNNSLFVSETQTDNKGNYNFNGLPSGFYTVKEIVPSCWYASNPNSAIQNVNLGARETIQADFLNCKVIMEPLIGVIGNNPFCESDSVILITTLDYFNYKWSTGDTSKQIVVKTPGRYSVIVQHFSGCTDSAWIDVFQNKKPAPQINVIGKNPFCYGDTITLEAIGNFSSYKWSTGDTTKSIKVHSSADYRLTVTDSINCSGFTEKKIDVLKVNPTIEIIGNNPFCDGDSVKLSVKEDFASYLWSTGESNREIVAAKSGTYVVTVTNSENCTGIDKISVSSRSIPAPVIEFTGNNPFCNGEEVILKTSELYLSYLWSNGKTTPEITVNKAGIYSVIVKDSNGCSGISANLTLDTIPSPQVKIIGPNVDCQFSQSSYSISNANSGSIKWVVTGGNIIGADNTEFVTVRWGATGTGQITVSRILPNSCVGKDTLQVTIGTSLYTSIKLSNPVLCEGASVVLTATPNGSSYKYQWQDGSTDSAITINQPGQYFVSIENLNGCKGFDTVNVVLHPLTTLKINGRDRICAGESIALSVNSTFIKYLWSTGDTSSQIIISKPGNYSVDATDSNGCISSTGINVLASDVSKFFAPLNNLSFGDKYLGENTAQTFNLINKSGEEIQLQSANFQNNKDVFSIEFSQSLPATIKPDSSISAKLSFNPNNVKDYTDSLIFNNPEPCNGIFAAMISGRSLAKTIVSFPDTTASIGDSKFRLPLRVRLIPATDKILKLSYKALISFDASSFVPEVVTNGIMQDDTINNGIRFLTISDDDAIVTGSESVLTEITGTIVLGNYDSSFIRINDFQWGNSLVDVEKQDGMLKLTGVCTMSLSRIRNFQGLNLEILPNPSNQDMKFVISSTEKGDYRIDVYNIQGEKVFTESWQKSSDSYNDIIKYFSIKQQSAGFFQVMLKSPTDNIVKPMYIFK